MCQPFFVLEIMDLTTALSRSILIHPNFCAMQIFALTYPARFQQQYLLSVKTYIYNGVFAMRPGSQVLAASINLASKFTYRIKYLAEQGSLMVTFTQCRWHCFHSAIITFSHSNIHKRHCRCTILFLNNNSDTSREQTCLSSQSKNVRKLAKSF